MEDSLAKGLSSFSFCATMIITSIVSGDGNITKEDKKCHLININI